MTTPAAARCAREARLFRPSARRTRHYVMRGAPHISKWRELDSQTPICQHPAMEIPASSLKLRANVPVGRKRFPISKLFTAFLSAACVCLISSCEKATPEQTFAGAVIKANLLSGFAGNKMRYQLEHPSAIMTPSGGTALMTRKAFVGRAILQIEESNQKTKGIGETDDNRQMLQASIALFDYVLPVYQNEYSHLADLYDQGAERAELEAVYKAITDKYLGGYQERWDALLAAGKPYAKRHDIRVSWDVQTSPSP